MAVTVRHDSEACGQAAFTAKRVPNRGEMLRAADFEHLDGRPVQARERMMCDSCGQPLSGVGQHNNELVAR